MNKLVSIRRFICPTFPDFAVQNVEVVSDHKTYENEKKLDSSIFELAQANEKYEECGKIPLFCFNDVSYEKKVNICFYSR